METRQNRRPIIASIYDLVLDSNTGRWAISWQAWAILIPAAVLVTANSYSSLVNQIGFAKLYLCGVLGIFAAGFVLLAANYTTHRNRRSKRVSPWTTAVVYVGAGAFRSVAVRWFIESQLPDYPELPPYWLVFLLGGIHGGFWLSFMSVTLMLAERFRNQQARIEQLNQEIASTKQDAEAALNQDVEEVQLMISQRLQPVINRVESQLDIKNSNEESLVDLAEELRATCDTEVRGLSHKLSKPVNQTFIEQPVAKQVSWRTVIQESFRETDIYIYSVVGLSSYMVVFLAIAQNHLTLVPPILMVMAQVLAFSVFLDLVLWRYVVWANRKLQAAVVGLLLMAATYLFVYANADIRADKDFIVLLFIDIPITYSAIWFMTSLLRGFEFVEKQSGQDIEKLSALLTRIQISVTKQRNRSRKILASLLHGKIQGRLAAVSLALVSARSQDPIQANKLLEEAANQLQKVKFELNEIMSMEAEVTKSEEAMELTEADVLETASEWSGLLDVSIEYTGVDFDLLSRLEMRDAVLVGLRESLANALRHGHARTVDVEIQVENDELLLKLVNDGKPIDIANAVDGQGAWEILATGGHRTFHVENGKTHVLIKWPLTVSIVK